MTVCATRGSDAADSRGGSARHVDQGSDYGGEPGEAQLVELVGVDIVAGDVEVGAELGAHRLHEVELGANFIRSRRPQERP